MRVGTESSLLALACVLLAAACGGGPASPSTSSSLTAGRWSGTTAQGAPITVDVSAAEMVTAISLGYSFNGCSGTKTFSGLNIPTKPDLVCVPGPCSSNMASYRAFAYLEGNPVSGASTTLNGLFLLGERVEGQVTFRDYPGCGTASSVTWAATRR